MNLSPALLRPLLFCLLLPLVLLGPGCKRKDPAERALETLKASHQSFTTDDFLKAAARGDAPAIALFLQAGMDKNTQDAHGRTALMAAAEAGKTDVVKRLLDENAKTDLQDKEGCPALLLAASKDASECVRLLVEANADVTLKGTLRVEGRAVPNWTALTKAVFDGSAKTVAVLLTTSRDRLARDGQLDRALLVACTLGNNAIVKALLDRGANANAALDRGQTPLMCAAQSGKADTVALLLARGANARAANADGATAGIIALQRGFPELAKTLDAAAAGLPAAAAATSDATPTPPPSSITGSSSPAPNNERQAAADAAAAAAGGAQMEQAWLRQNNVDPQTLLKKDTGLDSDKDGFTDDEEIAAGTDPNDPASHPPYHTKLRMKRLDAQTFPVLLESVTANGKHARVTVKTDGGKNSVDLAVGDSVPGVPYRVVRIRPRSIYEKDSGQPLDVSELTLTQTETGEKVTLVRSMQANAPNARAVLAFELAGGRSTDLEVRNGQEFTLPGVDDKTRYRVLDIRPTQVVLKLLPAGQTITVSTPEGNGDRH
ncbi:MAG: ankyrin repeat domain-containing protein [Verrucomicrobia bacterium]|nr:ankyrin repeat domain-containing protein [Verrucomicrobiota bacterium]